MFGWGNSQSEIKTIIKTYGRKDNWHKFDLKTNNLGYGWIHYGLIRILKPKKILCIGSRWGYIPAVCALACRDNNFGKVDFVDAGFDFRDYDGPGEHWGGIGFWKSCNPAKYFKKAKLENYINLYVMKSAEYENKFRKEKYGYVHVDGDHSYKGIKNDFKLFWPKLIKGGFMAFHDIGSPDKDGSIYGTRKFWEEIKSEKKAFLEILEDPGVGVIQK